VSNDTIGGGPTLIHPLLYHLGGLEGLSADQGNIASQGMIFLMYATGSGVPRDLVTAHMWINIAAANGLEAAPDTRDTLEQQKTREDILEATRRARQCMASNYTDCD
jgi:TPR repeat protein